MFYEIKTNDHEIFLNLSGEINIEESTFIREELLQLIDDGYQKINVDLRNVTFIDSSGLGVLVAIHNRLQVKGGHLVIRGLAGNVKELFELTRLTKLFHVE